MAIELTEKTKQKLRENGFKDKEPIYSSVMVISKVEEKGLSAEGIARILDRAAELPMANLGNQIYEILIHVKSAEFASALVDASEDVIEATMFFDSIVKLAKNKQTADSIKQVHELAKAVLGDGASRTRIFSKAEGNLEDSLLSIEPAQKESAEAAASTSALKVTDGIEKE